MCYARWKCSVLAFSDFWNMHHLSVLHWHKPWCFYWLKLCSKFCWYKCNGDNKFAQLLLQCKYYTTELILTMHIFWCIQLQNEKEVKSQEVEVCICGDIACLHYGKVSSYQGIHYLVAMMLFHSVSVCNKH